MGRVGRDFEFAFLDDWRMFETIGLRFVDRLILITVGVAKAVEKRYRIGIPGIGTSQRRTSVP